MEAWKKVWRDGFAPQLSTTGLTALARALKDDDPHLLQGATTSPPPLQTVQYWPVEAADAIAFCFIVDNGGFMQAASTGPTYADTGCTVMEAEEFFAKACFACDETLGDPAACRWFLKWYDETPRVQMRRELLVEVQRVLAIRRGMEAGGFPPDTEEGIILG